MEKKNYYKIKTSMTFEKIVLVPVDSVKDLNDAINLVDGAVETCEISLFNEEAEFNTKLLETTELPENDAGVFYQIIGQD